MARLAAHRRLLNLTRAELGKQAGVSKRTIARLEVDEFGRFGGTDIKFNFVNFPVDKWGTAANPVVDAAIAADPALSYIICIYDSMAGYVVPALAAAKLDGRVKVVGFNGTPFVLDLIRAGKFEMTVGESREWVSYAIADAEMRLIGGMGAVSNMHIPLRIFTTENAAEAGVPATFTKGYGDAFKSDYAKLWGL